MTEDLHQVFIDETTELLTTLEKSLLQLEEDTASPDGIAKVFRAMHTIKGTSGMFGYDSVSELTHQLETIFESIRDGQSRLTPEILKVTFLSLDHLKALLPDHQMNEDDLRHVHETLLKEIERVGATGQAKPHSIAATPQAAHSTLYYIAFSPFENMLRNGSNPLFLVEDLLALGKGFALPHLGQVPPLEKLKPDASCTSFEVLLETGKTESDIRDVFMFVASECELEVRSIPVTDGMLSDTLRQKLAEAYSPLTRLGYETVCVAAGADTSAQQEAMAAEKKPEAAQVAKAGTSGASIRVSAERLDELMNLVSELVTTQAQLSLFASLREMAGLEVISENVEKITRRLRDNAFSMSLIPIASLEVRFQRLVRDLSKDLDKEVDFVTEGTETEIDKSIMEKLSDPILHLLRNSIDHGIESKEERAKAGKPVKGTIKLKAFYAGANVVIEINDDGAGVNLAKVKDKAVSKGIISAEAALDEKEILDLIFLPGFSTAEHVTSISGRGVGMDVVRRNITDIRGEVEVSTDEGKGTTFTIRLPLTLSIIDGLLVRIGETDFILPLGSVNKCYEVPTKTLEETFNQWVTLEGERTSFIFLRKELNILSPVPALSQVIKIAYEGQYVGLAVDKIIGEYQAVLKQLGQLYRGQDEYSGATILGDGSVALVLDPYRLIKKLVGKQALDLRLPDAPKKKKSKK